MPKITFDNQQEKRSNSENDLFENKRFEEHDIKTRSARNHDWGHPEIKKNCTQKNSDFQIKKYTRQKSSNGTQGKFPQWVACALFSLLGAFAILMPLTNVSIPYEKTMLNISFTGIDIIKMSFENTTYLNIKGTPIHLMTSVAFAASLASSIIMKEKIANGPYIPVMFGVIAVACIFIAFEPATIVKLLKGFSICLTIQIASAVMLIAMNIMPLVNMIRERNRTPTKRKVF